MLGSFIWPVWARPQTATRLVFRSRNACAGAAVSDCAVALLSIGLLVAAAMPVDHDDRADRATASQTRADAAAMGANERAFGFYLGAPKHDPSDFHLEKPGATNLTIKNIEWYARPFQHPIYYGARWLRWGDSGQFGTMIDFTHSKAYSFEPVDQGQAATDPEKTFEGTINGKPAPAKAKVSDYFDKLEWTHGHNMLTYNGLMRLMRFGPFQTYAGAGGGISLPHSEIHLKTDASRTYEYQYTGPSAQALAGIEWRLPVGSIFFEYKFTSAIYWGPLTGRNGTWLPADLWSQITRWLSGEPPRDGWAGAILNSHQGIGGFMVRFQAKPAGS